MLRSKLLVAPMLLIGCSSNNGSVAHTDVRVPASGLLYAAPRAGGSAARVLYVRSLPVMHPECRHPRDADPNWDEKMRALSPAQRMAEVEAQDEESARCVREHAVALPLACWNGRWGTGAACLPRDPGARWPVDAMCYVQQAARRATRVAMRSDASNLAFAEPDGEVLVRTCAPPADGHGLQIAPEVEALVGAALGRDIIDPPTLFIVRQSVAEDLTGDGLQDLLLNVRIFLPGDDSPERDVLYLLPQGRLEDGVPPTQLRSTSGERSTESLALIATTDIDQDGHREIVLATSGYLAPVDTSLLLIDGEAARTLAKVSCTAEGIEFWTPR